MNCSKTIWGYLLYTTVELFDLTIARVPWITVHFILVCQMLFEDIFFLFFAIFSIFHDIWVKFLYVLRNKFQLDLTKIENFPNRPPL